MQVNQRYKVLALQTNPFYELATVVLHFFKRRHAVSRAPDDVLDEGLSHTEYG